MNDFYRFCDKAIHDLDKGGFNEGAVFFLQGEAIEYNSVDGLLHVLSKVDKSLYRNEDILKFGLKENSKRLLQIVFSNIKDEKIQKIKKIVYDTQNEEYIKMFESYFGKEEDVTQKANDDLQK